MPEFYRGDSTVALVPVWYENAVKTSPPKLCTGDGFRRRGIENWLPTSLAGQLGRPTSPDRVQQHLVIVANKVREWTGGTPFLTHEQHPSARHGEMEGHYG